MAVSFTFVIAGVLDLSIGCGEILILPMAFVGSMLNKDVSLEQIEVASGVLYGFLTAFLIVRPKKSWS